MRYEDFIEKRKGHQDFYVLNDHVCYYVTYGDIDRFHDKGWPRKLDEDDDGTKRTLVITGLIVNHRTETGDTCGGYVSFVHPRSPSALEAKAPLWDVTQIEPLTIHPSVLCHCKKLHGFIRGGTWVDA